MTPAEFFFILRCGEIVLNFIGGESTFDFLRANPRRLEAVLHLKFRIKETVATGGGGVLLRFSFVFPGLRMNGMPRGGQRSASIRGADSQ